MDGVLESRRCSKTKFFPALFVARCWSRRSRANPAAHRRRRRSRARSAADPRQIQQATGIHAEATYQSSAMLTTQIENGAPFDVFLSADLSYPKRLIDAGLADAAGSADSTTPITYARGTLVLWERKDSHLPPPSLDLLRIPRLKRLAIANPDRAPYGRAAVAALQSLKLYDALKPRLVTAENIAQAAQFVDSANADAGLISLTSALTPRLSRRRRVFRDPARPLSAHRAGRGHRQQHQTARRRAQAARLSALASGPGPARKKRPDAGEVKSEFGGA